MALASADKSTADYIFANVANGEIGLEKIMSRVGVVSASATRAAQAKQHQAHGIHIVIGADGLEYAVDTFGRTFLWSTGEQVFYNLGGSGLPSANGHSGPGAAGDVLHFFPSQQMKILRGILPNDTGPV